MIQIPSSIRFIAMQYNHNTDSSQSPNFVIHDNEREIDAKIEIKMLEIKNSSEAIDYTEKGKKTT